MKKTHDGLDVYPEGSDLPENAIGWTRCRLFDGACLTWIADEDNEAYKTHLDSVRSAMKVLTTKKGALATMDKLGISTIGVSKLRDMRLRIENRIIERSWPLIEVN
ncbi:MAG: hypothetical protein BV458_12235 [Thermoplasmata archaeon M9B2D]|nr:MAG: hypothetical protein BV458_12235 [Thermoplasmata archaeon M9B2D]